ncbi:LOW QUALITY PROTEIN: hypothetical protein MAR_019846, partial [Mya arenaria]
MVKKVVLTEKGNKNELIQEMVHIFTAQWQTKQFKQNKANIPAGSVLQVMDFANKRQIKYQMKSRDFFTNRQVTMHPKKIIEELKKRIIFSDGCSAQYKSKGPFADFANERTEINRNYFGSEHGKSECDVEIGLLNRSLGKAIIGNKAVLNSAEDVCNYCHSDLEVDDVPSTRNFIYVKYERWIETDPKLIDKNSQFPPEIEQYKRTRFVKEKQLQQNEVTVVKTEANVANPAVPKFNSEEIHGSKSQENLESTVSYPLTYSRQDYFLMILSKMCLCESFGNLQIILATIEDEVRELYGDIHFNPDLGMGLQLIDWHIRQPFNNRTVEAHWANNNYEDRNCLPRSGSILSFEDEDHHAEIRCRIAIEMVTNIDLYLSDEHLQNGEFLLEKEARHLVKTCAMFSEHYRKLVKLA